MLTIPTKAQEQTEIHQQVQQFASFVPSFQTSDRQNILKAISPKNKYGPKFIQIKKGLWYRHKLSQKMKFIQEWRAQEIYLNGNRQPTILKDISHIQLNKCQILDLSGNLIDSIQNICLMNSPCLSKLILSQNLLTSLKQLRKINLSSLNTLQIKNNRLSQTQFICEANLPQLKIIVVQMSPVDCLQSENITNLLKIDTENLKKLCKHIVNTKIYKIIEELEPMLIKNCRIDIHTQKFPFSNVIIIDCLTNNN